MLHKMLCWLSRRCLQSSATGCSLYLRGGRVPHPSDFSSSFSSSSSSSSSSSTGTSKHKLFPIIKSSFDPLSHPDEVAKNLEANLNLFSQVRATRAKILSADSEVRKQERASRKLTIQERIDLLRDEGSEVLDIGVFAGLHMPYGSVYNASTAVCIVRIAGETCVVTANDWTFKGGTVYPITVKKQLRAQEIAMENRLPCIYLVDSGGAFLPLQADVFPDRNHGGRVFRNEAVLSSMGIPQISVVCGPCTAGGAYIPTMSDEAVMVKGIGSLYLAGPPLVRAATGEKISAEDLGGADVHCRISGCTDHYVETEEEALETTRRIVLSLNLWQRGRERELTTEPPQYCFAEETFAKLLPQPNENGMWPALDVIARLVDGSRFSPFKETYGTTLHAGFAHINGRLVGVLANDGELTATAATKGTHFVRLCTFRDIPLIFLQNTPSDFEFLTPGGNEGLTVKARAQMMSAVACATVPKITVVVGGSYGPSSYAMCGRALQPNFLFTWPHARLAVASPDHQLAALREKGMSEDSDEKEVELIKRLHEEASVHPSSNLVTDGVILPYETRKVLTQALEACTIYRRPSSSPPPLNVLRM